MGWRRGHRNERRVQFADRGRRCNHKHCQPVGRSPRHLRTRTRRERLPGLPDLGANQCGVPGCDWRCNPNTYCHGNDNTHRHTETHAIATSHSVPKGSSNSSAAAVADFAQRFAAGFQATVESKSSAFWRWQAGRADANSVKCFGPDSFGTILSTLAVLQSLRPLF